MPYLENLKFNGNLNILVYSAKTRELKYNKNFKNLVVTSGLSYITSRMKDNTKNPMGFMGIGDGTQIQSALDTNLLGVNKFRKSIFQVTESSSNIIYVTTFESQDNIVGGAITEAGIFNNITDGVGDMLCRTTFPVINKGPDDMMTITWTINLEVTE